jgi:hypothetical protein
MAVHQRPSIGRSYPCFWTFKQDHALRPISCSAHGLRAIVRRYVGKKAAELANMRRYHVSRPCYTEQNGGVALKRGQSISIEYRRDIQSQDLKDSLPN